MNIEELRNRVRVAEREIERTIDNLKDATGYTVTKIRVHSSDKEYPLKADITIFKNRPDVLEGEGTGRG